MLVASKNFLLTLILNFPNNDLRPLAFLAGCYWQKFGSITCIVSLVAVVGCLVTPKSPLYRTNWNELPKSLFMNCRSLTRFVAVYYNLGIPLQLHRVYSGERTLDTAFWVQLPYPSCVQDVLLLMQPRMFLLRLWWATLFAHFDSVYWKLVWH